MEKWDIKYSSVCKCGDPSQTMNHITEKCSIHSYTGGLPGIHKLENEAIKWLCDLKLDS